MTNSPLLNARACALAFLYEQMADCPTWFQSLTPEQIEDVADLMVQWQPPSSLAFLYDRMKKCPDWFRRLTPRQIQDVADVMVQWQLPRESSRILTMEEIEQREVLRAVMICQGNVIKAAQALNIGKTTIYTKLRKWGYLVNNRVLLAQASALRNPVKLKDRHLGNPSYQPRNEQSNRSHQEF